MTRRAAAFSWGGRARRALDAGASQDLFSGLGNVGQGRGFSLCWRGGSPSELHMVGRREAAQRQENASGELADSTPAGATWNSSVNRDQVRDCVNFLGKLVPLMIEVMMF